MSIDPHTHTHLKSCCDRKLYLSAHTNKQTNTHTVQRDLDAISLEDDAVADRCQEVMEVEFVVTVGLLAMLFSKSNKSFSEPGLVQLGKSYCEF